MRSIVADVKRQQGRQTIRQYLIDEVRKAVAEWPEFAREAGVSPEGIDHIGRYYLTRADCRQPQGLEMASDHHLGHHDPVGG